MSLLVDIVGIAGFILSTVLAIYQITSNRLSIKLDNAILIDSKYHPDSFFLFVCLSNKTKAPFSLIDVKLDIKKHIDLVSFEKKAHTYTPPMADNKAVVKPVVLSRAFPARFDSYASEVFFLEVLRQYIDIQSLPLCAPDRSQKGRIHRLFLRIRTSCTHPPRPRLMLSTSRGHLAVDLQLSSIESSDWLKDYAVRKSVFENKIEFP